MAAIEPELGAGGHEFGKVAARQPLQPCRPFGLGHAALEGCRRQAAIAGGAQRRDRGAGIDVLVAPGETRQRQIEQAIAILVDQPSAILMDVEVLRPDQDLRSAGAFGGGLQHGGRLRLLRRDHGGCAALEDAGLLAGDLGHGVAEIFGMVGRDRSDHRAGRMVDDVGGVVAPAEPDLEQHDIRLMLGEQQQRRRGGDFEEGDGIAGIGALAALQRLDQHVLVDEAPAARPAEPDPLMEAHQMRRGVDVDAEAGRLEDRPHEGDGRALAIGAGDMDHRRQALLRIAEALEQAQYAAEREVDQLGMQRQEARQQQVGCAHAAPAPRPAKASRRCGAAAGDPQCVVGKFSWPRERAARLPRSRSLPGPAAWSGSGRALPASPGCRGGGRPCRPCRDP